MKMKRSLVVAVSISTCAVFPALAQDAATQAILDANQQAAVQQVQQYNDQMRQVATDNAEQARKSMSQNNNGGVIDLDRLFGLVQDPAPVVVSPQETIPAPHHRYRHRRKPSS